MWRSLGSLTDSVREGLQEFKRDALRETSLIKSTVAQNVGQPVTKSLTQVEQLGKKVLAGASGPKSNVELEHVKVQATDEDIQSPPVHSEPPIPITSTNNDGWENPVAWDEQIEQELTEDKPLLGFDVMSQQQVTNPDDRVDVNDEEMVSVPLEQDMDAAAIEIVASEETEASNSGPDAIDELSVLRDQKAADRLKIEGLESLSWQLRASLDSLVAEKNQIAENLSRSEDDLQRSIVENQKLALRVDELAEAKRLADRMAEEELDAAQNDYRALKERTMAAEEKANRMEKDTAAARKERESLEQKVKTITAALEKRMKSLTAELQSRQEEVDALREENVSMSKGFSELKALLQEAVAERDSLADSVTLRDSEIDSLRQNVAKLASEVEASRREAAENSVSLAEAMAEVHSLRGQVSGNAVSQSEREALEGSLKAAMAAAEQAASEAKEWKEKSEKLEGDLKNRGKALAQTEAELTLANERVLEAESEAAEARRLRAEAEGTSEQLREQTERRAKVFNAAVKAAVHKIQSELEAERDEAMARVSALEEDSASQSQHLQAVQMDMRELADRLEEAKNSLVESQQKVRGLEERIREMEGEIETAAGREMAAMESENAAKEVTYSLTKKLAGMDAQFEELKLAAIASEERATKLMADLDLERQRTRDSQASFEREKTALKISALETSSKAMAEVSLLKGKISALESSSSSHGLSIKDPIRTSEKYVSALEGLGLEKVTYRDRSGPVSEGRSLGKSSAGWLRRVEESERAIVPGRISKRSFIVGVYIVLLHIMVMVSFTQRSCTESKAAKVFPGQ